MNNEILNVELSHRQFEEISRRVYSLCGINLHDGKQGLVKSRLSKRLRQLGLDNYDRYLKLVETDRRELTCMIDSLTTNKTSFFREEQHFDYLRRQILPRLLATKSRLRIWSAGCSSGREAYTLAMILREDVPDLGARDVRILATDISTRILAEAKAATYGPETVEEVPPTFLQKYFIPGRDASGATYRVKDEVKSLVSLARLNFMDEWPMRGPFDMIFCRNVMIYFDKGTQQRLVRRFWEKLEPGGHLFIGHSESLANTSNEFRYVQPAAYVK